MLNQSLFIRYNTPLLTCPLIVIFLLTITTGCGGDSNQPNNSSTSQDQSGNVEGNCTLTAEESNLLNAHNNARAVARQCGNVNYSAAPALVWNCTLGKAALNHSTDMASVNFFSHTGSDGSSPFDRLSYLGYQYTSAGENIAAGQSSVESVVAGWLDSPGHCSNIMNKSFTQMGAARVNSNTADYSSYWTVVFATPQ